MTADKPLMCEHRGCAWHSPFPSLYHVSMELWNHELRCLLSKGAFTAQERINQNFEICAELSAVSGAHECNIFKTTPLAEIEERSLKVIDPPLLGRILPYDYQFLRGDST